MTQGKIVRKPWKRKLAGLRELSDWAGVQRPAIDSAIRKMPDFPEAVDHLGMGNVYDFEAAVAALESAGFSEGGGPRAWGSGRRRKEASQDAVAD